MKMRVGGIIYSVVLIAGLSMACDQMPVPEQVYGTNVARPLISPYTTPKRSLTPELDTEDQKKRLADTNKLLDDFGSRADVAFGTPEAEKHLEGLERFYMATGRYLELVSIFRKAYDKYGPGHYIAPHLAWAYVTIDNDAAAAEVLSKAKTARPRDAFVHFVDGYLIGKDGVTDPALGKLVYAAWRRTITLDPDFKGPRGVTASRIGTRLKDMERLMKQQGITPPPLELEASPQPTSQPAPTDAPASAPAPADPSDSPSDPRLVQAESLLARGDYHEAGKLFTEVLKVDTNNARADYGRAISAWKSKGVEPANAEKFLRRVIQRQDLTAQQRYELGVIFLRDLKDKETALTLWRKAATLDPTFAESVKLEETIERVSKP